MDSHQEVCQACRRVRDDYPAGRVTMSGDFVRAHKMEILNLARHHEQDERAQHPLHRIIKVEERPDSVVVSTTDVHLPRRIGDALRRAFKGRSETHYDEGSCFVRVNWHRKE